MITKVNKILKKLKDEIDKKKIDWQKNKIY